MSTNTVELLSSAQAARDSKPAQTEQIYKDILALKAGQ